MLMHVTSFNLIKGFAYFYLRYGSCATARDFEIYAPDATFEDPLMCAHGYV